MIELDVADGIARPVLRYAVCREAVTGSGLVSWPIDAESNHLAGPVVVHHDTCDTAYERHWQSQGAMFCQTVMLGSFLARLLDRAEIDLDEARRMNTFLAALP